MALGAATAAALPGAAPPAAAAAAAAAGVAPPAAGAVDGARWDKVHTLRDIGAIMEEHDTPDLARELLRCVRESMDDGFGPRKETLVHLLLDADICGPDDPFEDMDLAAEYGLDKLVLQQGSVVEDAREEQEAARLEKLYKGQLYTALREAGQQGPQGVQKLQQLGVRALRKFASPKLAQMQVWEHAALEAHMRADAAGPRRPELQEELGLKEHSAWEDRRTQGEVRHSVPGAVRTALGRSERMRSWAAECVQAVRKASSLANEDAKERELWRLRTFQEEAIPGAAAAAADRQGVAHDRADRSSGGLKVMLELASRALQKHKEAVDEEERVLTQWRQRILDQRVELRSARSLICLERATWRERLELLAEEGPPEILGGTWLGAAHVLLPHHRVWYADTWGHAAGRTQHLPHPHTECPTPLPVCSSVAAVQPSLVRGHTRAPTRPDARGTRSPSRKRRIRASSHSVGRGVQQCGLGGRD